MWRDYVPTALLIFLGILFIITMFLTFYAFHQEEKKMKRYEEEGDTISDQLKRSREYESQSIKYHVPIQLWIYLITFILTIIAFVIYLY